MFKYVYYKTVAPRKEFEGGMADEGPQKLILVQWPHATINYKHTMTICKKWWVLEPDPKL